MESMDSVTFKVSYESDGSKFWKVGEFVLRFCMVLTPHKLERLWTLARKPDYRLDFVNPSLDL